MTVPHVRHGVDGVLEKLGPCIRQRQTARVSGPSGSGRSLLVRRLVETHGALLIEPPELGEPDTIAHALHQACRRLGRAVDGGSTADVVAALAGALAEQERPLVIRLDRSWIDLGRPPNTEHERARFAEARALLDGWTGSRLAVVFVVESRHVGPRSSRVPDLELPPAVATRAFLEDPEHWGGLAPTAHKMADALPRDWAGASPVVLRLAVGLAALEDPASAAERLSRGATPGELVAHITNAAPDHDLIPALRRLRRIRSPLPARAVEEVVDAPRVPAALFTHCLGYGGPDSVRVAASTRRALLQRLHDFEGRSAASMEPTHARLAAAHRQLDGQTDPNAVGAESIVHWLEKLHHLSQGGPACDAEWSRQEVGHPELLIARARALSLRGDCAEAAALYERAVALDPGNAYAHHYLGYNLREARRDRPRVQACFDEARRLDPENPWWNSRRITWLIEQARFREAEQAWQEALAAIDPDGDAATQNPDLPLHLHRHVAEAWLALGEVGRARDVLDAAGGALGHPALRRLARELEDADEARRLGAAVRPARLRGSERWTPRLLARRDVDGRALVRWFAGRVEAVAPDGGVELVFATTEPELGARRLLRKRLSAEAWHEVADWAAEAARFVEIGEYAGVDAEGGAPEPRVVRILRFEDAAPKGLQLGDDEGEPWEAVS